MIAWFMDFIKLRLCFLAIFESIFKFKKEIKPEILKISENRCWRPYYIKHFLYLWHIFKCSTYYNNPKPSNLWSLDVCWAYNVFIIKRSTFSIRTMGSGASYFIKYCDFTFTLLFRLNCSLQINNNSRFIG
jgi:hypothetical protein